MPDHMELTKNVSTSCDIEWAMSLRSEIFHNTSGKVFTHGYESQRARLNVRSIKCGYVWYVKHLPLNTSVCNVCQYAVRVKR